MSYSIEPKEVSRLSAADAVRAAHRREAAQRLALAFRYRALMAADAQRHANFRKVRAAS